MWSLLFYLVLAFLFAGWLYIGEASRPSWSDPLFWTALLVAFLVAFYGWWIKNKLHPKPPNPDVFNLTPCSDDCEPAAPPKLRRPVERVLKP